MIKVYQFFLADIGTMNASKLQNELALEQCQWNFLKVVFSQQLKVDVYNQVKYVIVKGCLCFWD